MLISLIKMSVIFFALTYVVGIIYRRYGLDAQKTKVFIGILLGVAAIIGMSVPFNFSSDVIFDPRSVVVSLAGAFGGVLGAFPAIVMAGAYRLWIGGYGANAGTLVVVVSGLSGWIFYHLWRRTNHQLKWWDFVLFGFVTHILCIFPLLILPADVRWSVIRNLSIPFFVLYPIFSALLGGLILDLQYSVRAVERLRARESRLQSFLDKSPMPLLITRWADSQIVYANPSAARALGGQVEALVGTKGVDFYVDPSQRYFLANTVMTHGEIRDFQVQIKKLDGTLAWILVNAQLTHFENQEALNIGFIDITDHLNDERNIRDYVKQIENMIFGTVDAISKMVEMRDPYTSGHEQRVGEISAAIAAEMGLDSNFQKGLRLAGAVHDVGKLGVASEILSRPGVLSAPEFEIIKGHAQQGFEMLKAIASPWPLAEIARQHHERIDGSGYPQGLKGDAIILEARILAIADVVESMSSHRPYRPALGIDAALNEIEKGMGKLYDAEASASCLRLFREKGYSIPQ